MNKLVLTHKYKVRQCKHTYYSRFESVFSEENRARLSDSQFRTRKTSRSIGNTGRTSCLAYHDAFPAEERKDSSPLLMLAKVWRNNQFTGHQGRMLGNDGGSPYQVCRLVRLPTSRGESLLKVCEKISVGWIVQSSSSLPVR